MHQSTQLILIDVSLTFIALNLECNTCRACSANSQLRHSMHNKLASLMKTNVQITTSSADQECIGTMYYMMNSKHKITLHIKFLRELQFYKLQSFTEN